MKKTAIWILLIPVMLFACSSQGEDAMLTEGTPAHQLAMDLTALLPAPSWRHTSAGKPG